MALPCPDLLLVWAQSPAGTVTWGVCAHCGVSPGADTCTDGFFSVLPKERELRFFREFCRRNRVMSYGTAPQQ